MAQQTATKLWQSPGKEMQAVLYRVPLVTSGDTIIVNGDFNKVIYAAACEVSSASALITITTVISGSPPTTITFTGTGLSADDLYVLVVGAGV